eukprot:1754514-Rhodomonas_salina.1
MQPSKPSLLLPTRAGWQTKLTRKRWDSSSAPGDQCLSLRPRHTFRNYALTTSIMTTSWGQAFEQQLQDWPPCPTLGQQRNVSCPPRSCQGGAGNLPGPLDTRRSALRVWNISKLTPLLVHERS